MAGVKRISGSPNIRGDYTMASATPSVAQGDLVKLDGSGLVVIATAASILGIMRSADPSSTSTKVLIDVIVPDHSEFVIKYKASATAAALKTDYAGLTFTTTAITVDDTASGDVVIQDLDPRDAVGTSGGRLICRFIPSALQSVTGQA